MAPDLNEPVELSIRGDRIDVIGLVSHFAKFYEDYLDEIGVDGGRAENVAIDFVDQINKQENLGLMGREMKKAADRGDIDDYRGIQSVIKPFDPQHPDPDIERIDLEDADMYVLVAKTDKGFEAAGWPERHDVQDGLLIASFLRMYARDLEGEIDAQWGPEDIPE